MLLKRSPWLLNQSFKQAAAYTKSRTKLATIRLALGDILENHAAEQALAISSPSSTRSTISDTELAKLCQLYFDSFAVAVWTSVHAEYLYNSKQTTEDLPDPDLFLVPSAFTQLNLIYLYERKNGLGNKLLPKESTSLVQLIARCTNPGARGWQPVVQNTMKCSTGKRVLIREIEVCFLGLHPCIHPAMRFNWKKRFNVLHCTGSLLWSSDYGDEIQKSSVYLKEVMKRHVGTMFANAPAMATSLAVFSHPCAFLQQPPMQFSHVGLEAAMTAFVLASDDLVAGTPMSTALEKQFSAASNSTTALKWSPGWLGKGTVSVPTTCPLVSFAESVFLQSFKLPFLGLWTHAKTHDVRLSKLDNVQHAAINELAAATRLCNTLSEQQQLRVQRIAMNSPFAGLLTIQQTLSILGYEGNTMKQTNPKHVKDILLHIESTFGVVAISKLLCFARVAWVKETLLTFQFSDNVVQSQCNVILKRLKHDVAQTSDLNTLLQHVYSLLPSQATCLCVCTECERVANAFVCTAVCDDKKFSSFNELGVSQSMIRYSDLQDTKQCILCAKRSSAAFRAGVAFQNTISERMVECDELKDEEIKSMLINNTNDVASKLRRDCRNALEQRPISNACGSKIMLQIPLIGRCVRIYDSFYTLCGFCACVVKTTDFHRFKDRICCLRCDEAMLGLQKAELAVSGNNIKKLCRYCGAGMRPLKVEFNMKRAHLSRSTPSVQPPPYNSPARS